MYALELIFDFRDRQIQKDKNPPQSSNSFSNSINSLLSGSNRLNEYYGGLNGKIETVDSLLSNPSILKNTDLSPRNKILSPSQRPVKSSFGLNNAIPNVTSNNNFNPSSQR